MRFTTSNKLIGGRRTKFTVVHWDCGHKMSYEGHPDEAEHRLRQEGGTIGHGSVTRCAPCSRQFAATLADVLGMIGEKH